MTVERYETISGRRGAVAVRAGENISLKEALGQWTVTELRAQRGPGTMDRDGIAGACLGKFCKESLQAAERAVD